MKTPTFPAFVLALAGCANGGATPERIVVPGERVGPLTSTTAEAELVEQLGPLVRTGLAIDIGEGFCVEGAMMFPDSPDAVEIAWSDSAHSRPAFARIRSAGARWTTPAGVHIGMTLEELERINGEPVAFSGFGWDYGGTASWSEDKAENDDVMFLLELAPDSASETWVRENPRYEEIIGERTITSDHPLIQEMTIRVRGMSLRWAEPGPETTCPALSFGSALDTH